MRTTASSCLLLHHPPILLTLATSVTLPMPVPLLQDFFDPTVRPLFDGEPYIDRWAYSEQQVGWPGAPCCPPVLADAAGRPNQGWS